MTSVTISNGVPAAANVTSGDTKWNGVIVNDFSHSHGISIAASSKANQLTLAHGTKYELTAGGQSFIFTTPSDTNTSHNHSAGVGLVGSGSAGTGGGTYTYKAKLRSETALTMDSAAATITSGRVYPVAVDKSGYLSVNVPWTDTNTHQTVADKNPTLAWGTKSTVATIGSTDIHVTMPANPNTDTHWTARSYVGSKDAHANTTTTNGNTYLQLFENGTIRDQHNIVGSGATTVASDASGKITINTDVSGKADKTYVDDRVSGYESWTFTTLSGTTITKKVCIHN